MSQTQTIWVTVKWFQVMTNYIHIRVIFPGCLRFSGWWKLVLSANKKIRMSGIVSLHHLVCLERLDDQSLVCWSVFNSLFSAENIWLDFTSVSRSDDRRLKGETYFQQIYLIQSTFSRIMTDCCISRKRVSRVCFYPKKGGRWPTTVNSYIYSTAITVTPT